MLPNDHPLNTGRTSSSPLILNMRGVRTRPLPVWFMRQAGRSLPEYRKMRENIPMLDSCLTPDVAAEITLQPVRRHHVDAAIFFSDIVIPLKLSGIDVDIKPGVGPVISEPVRTQSDIQRLRELGDIDLSPITEAVRILCAELGNTPLIGFGGAPFTLASYLIEGGPSRDLPHSRHMMTHDPTLWSTILSWCADVTATFIQAQVLAGASALQVFDSWAGKLDPKEYLKFALPHSRRLFDQLTPLVDGQGEPVPRVHFGLGTQKILTQMHSAGATVMGVDFHTPLTAAQDLLGSSVPLQGNINPALLTAPWSEIRAHLDDVLDQGASSPGHIVNLGHGVPPETDPDVLTRIVEYVHLASA
ncbi:uroporphyrinogen decarboxylase [Aurantimicrobium minutum]|uniref:uroporphyrinogen decarboxylase n=1 Tax=Aurantimicrobium minutum TaxID=708131 RepID=UPI0032AE947F